MNKLRRLFRPVLTIVAVTAGALVLGGASIIAAAEWDARTVVAHGVPTDFSAMTTGPSGAPVLILLHGAGLNGHMWDPVRRGLDARYRVIALDLPGYGSRLNETFTLEAATATVVSAARSVAPAQLVLVGDSLGGYTAMAAARLLPPEQLRGLVVGGCSANFEGMRALTLNYLKNLFIVKMVRTFFDEQKFLSKALANDGMSPDDGKAILAAGASLRALPASIRSLLFIDFRAKLADIEQPVLIVNGTLDHRAMNQEPSFLAAARHPSNYHFDHSEHGVSMRRSAGFAALVNDFAATAFSASQAPSAPLKP
ncbi:MAG: alpha/beta fold hydrolase [Pseudomonadota bacterium]